MSTLTSKKSHQTITLALLAAATIASPLIASADDEPARRRPGRPVAVDHRAPATRPPVVDHRRPPLPSRPPVVDHRPPSRPPVVVRPPRPRPGDRPVVVNPNRPRPRRPRPHAPPAYPTSPIFHRERIPGRLYTPPPRDERDPIEMDAAGIIAQAIQNRGCERAGEALR
jgi:hypothetical protein